MCFYYDFVTFCLDFELVFLCSNENSLRQYNINVLKGLFQFPQCLPQYRKYSRHWMNINEVASGRVPLWTLCLRFNCNVSWWSHCLQLKPLSWASDPSLWGYFHLMFHSHSKLNISQAESISYTLKPAFPSLFHTNEGPASSFLLASFTPGPWATAPDTAFSSGHTS